MSPIAIKIFLAIACAGHILCCFCDRAITYTPNGRFGFNDLNDNERLAALFEGSSKKRQMFSILGGILALAMTSLGYVALCSYVASYSAACGIVLLVSFAPFIVAGAAHHVFCGAVEWFYIRLGRTEEARKVIVEFFKKTLPAMYVCFIGLMIFAVTLFVAIITGTTGLPRWACVFNVLPMFIVILPFRLVGSFNIASAAQFLGLFIVFCAI